MSDDRAELHALIVSNMAELEDSYRELSAVQASVFSEMDKIARDWAKANGWFGLFGYWTDGLTLAPDSWRVEVGSDKATAKAWFQLGHGDGDDDAEEKWDLGRLCHIRSDVLGFQIWPDWKVHGMKLPAWKRAARAHVAELHAVGFSIGANGTIFRQVTVGSEILAQAVRSANIASALEPWRNALDQLQDAVPVVERIIARATSPS